MLTGLTTDATCRQKDSVGQQLLLPMDLGDVQSPVLQTGQDDGTLLPVTQGQRRKGKSMRRRSGQSGQVVRKGQMWHVRFYADVPMQGKRQRKSVPIGPATGKEKLTRPEALRRGAEIVGSFGVNTSGHLERAIHPESVQTFRQRVEWCRKYHKAWTDGKPGPVSTMESQLAKHILPRLGDLPLTAVDETVVQEFVAELKRTTFEMRRPAGKTRKLTGDIVKTYGLSRKTVLNIVGVVKLVLGRKVWVAWDLNLGKPRRPRQRYFTEDELRRIIDAAPGQFRMLFLLLAGTGMRIGEAAGLYREDIDLENCVVHVRREVWKGKELPPKTDNAEREIDIDPLLAEILRKHLDTIKGPRVFAARNGSPISDNNVRNRILTPLLVKLGIPKGGLHAFRHSRVTILRKRGTPADLQTQWIGHSSLRTTDRYSHTDQELEYRRKAASHAGIDSLVGPNGPKPDRIAARTDAELKATA
jgi:integrase